MPALSSEHRDHAPECLQPREIYTCFFSFADEVTSPWRQRERLLATNHRPNGWTDICAHGSASATIHSPLTANPSKIPTAGIY